MSFGRDAWVWIDKLSHRPEDAKNDRRIGDETRACQWLISRSSILMNFVSTAAAAIDWIESLKWSRSVDFKSVGSEPARTSD